MYIVSRCLLGVPCKYNGGDNRCEAVLRFLEGKEYYAACPETAGGLTAPREPAEIQGDRVMDRAGVDRTEAFRTGAATEWAAANARAAQLRQPIEGAILKANSPSCGAGQIYDGTFTGTLVPGDGCFAGRLRAEGIPMQNEHDFENPTGSPAAQNPAK